MGSNTSNSQSAGTATFEANNVDTTTQSIMSEQVNEAEMTTQVDVSPEPDDDGQNPGASSPLPAAPQVLPEVRSWNRANHAFEIFVDNEAISGAPAAMTPREDGRRILGLLKPNALNRTGPRLRSPSTPFTFNIFDANWEDLENYLATSPTANSDSDPSFDSSPAPATPLTPATPVTPITPATPATPSAPVIPTLAPPAAAYPSASTRPTTSRPSTNARGLPKAQFTRVPLRLRQRNLVPAGSPVKIPRNMELYNLLEIKDWTANVSEIKAAYKIAAVKYHPDKFDVENREMAHVRMSRINAARDVLLNDTARKQYHEDGKLPWKI
ncbi:hypothetical protein DM02DRAFT_632668 [Periconia macrospinosa]|uniref:J domain-containing protein n=1 Tax=Periconia macrospinosa TaxID=97972 RepID=A0A2V1DC26_9PLEO|nr:hypothetical protein DM02DRAFT_632668 [Periconia macrospinosa]